MKTAERSRVFKFFKFERKQEPISSRCGRKFKLVLFVDERNWTSSNFSLPRRNLGSMLLQLRRNVPKSSFFNSWAKARKEIPSVKTFDEVDGDEVGKVTFFNFLLCAKKLLSIHVRFPPLRRFVKSTSSKTSEAEKK